MTLPSGRFDDSGRAAAYDHRIRKIRPGYETLHGMVEVILASELKAEASVLIAGAGTGQEILLLSQAHPGWHFTAIEPAKPMIAIAREKLTQAGVADRVAWFEGAIEDFPGEDLYDAVTLIMVLHLVAEENQYPVLQDLSDRLHPGSPLLMADVFGDPETARFKRMDTYSKAWAIAAGLDAEGVNDTFNRVSRADFHVFTEERLKGWLRQAGFIDIQRFYQALHVGAWIARTNR